MSTYLGQQYSSVAKGGSFNPQVVQDFITNFDKAMKGLRLAQKSGGGIAEQINKDFVRKIFENLNETLALVKSEF